MALERESVCVCMCVCFVLYLGPSMPHLLLIIRDKGKGGMLAPFMALNKVLK